MTITKKSMEEEEDQLSDSEISNSKSDNSEE